MAKAVKLSDIAQTLGVSNVTVSKALSGQKGVSEELRQKIITLADSLGYKQPAVARREAAGQKKKSYQIGVLLDEHYLDSYDSFYWQLYQQISSYAMEENCYAVPEVITPNLQKQKELPKLIREKRIDGLIIIGKMRSEYLSLLKEYMDENMVFLDFTTPDFETDAVVSDNFYGAYRMTSYLLSKGHKEIAYVGNIRATGSIADRYFGYRKALLEHDIEPLEEWVIEDREKGSPLILDDYLILPTRMPTAFFCNCDLTAARLIKKLEAKGYRVPEDISVAGFDNFVYPGACDIAITTYEADRSKMARKSVDLLIRRMGGVREYGSVHVVEGRILEKKSVAAKNRRKK